MEDSPPEFITFHKPVPPRPLVYELALDLVTNIQGVLDGGGARFHLKNQLDRGTTQIAMVLAHVFEDPPRIRWRRYRAALAHATTCSTLLDILERQGTEVGPAQRTMRRLRAELVPLAHGH